MVAATGQRDPAKHAHEHINDSTKPVHEASA